MKSITQYNNESNVPEINDSDLSKGIVDLGLSVKWASCNIGADKPYEYGKLFQFGRVDGYEYGDSSHQFITYKQNKADTENKYIPLTTSGKTYSKGEVLDKEDDAAYVATNGKLRMPTKKEIDELLNNTKNKICKVNGVYGRLFTGSNGNNIFIPAAGYFDDNHNSFYNEGSDGDIWSSSVESNNDDSAYYLDFYSGGCSCAGYYRCGGFSVRGVCKY